MDYRKLVDKFIPFFSLLFLLQYEISQVRDMMHIHLWFTWMRKKYMFLLFMFRFLLVFSIWYRSCVINSLFHACAAAALTWTSHLVVWVQFVEFQFKPINCWISKYFHWIDHMLDDMFSHCPFKHFSFCLNVSTCFSTPSISDIF